MLFLLKKPLIYPGKYYKILWFTCWFLGIFAQLVTLIPLAKAEGSYELVKSGIGYRPYLLHANDTLDFANDIPAGSGIPYKTTIKVFVKQGEQVNVGSSVPGSANDPEDIVYFHPDGPKVGSCNVEEYDQTNNPWPKGLIRTTDEEENGPEPSNATSDIPDKYRPCTFTAPTTGVYQIEFHAPKYTDSGGNNTPNKTPASDPFPTNTLQMVGIAAWDVTVFEKPDDPTTKKIGRVYANYLPLYTKESDSSIHSQFFILSKVGNIYQINLNGIQPQKFLFFANNKGFLDNSSTNPILKSVSAQSGDNVYFHRPNKADDSSNVTYKIFFNEPFANDPHGSVPSEVKSFGDSNNGSNDKTWLFSPPPPLPTISDFKFTGVEGTPNQAGTTGPKGGNFSFEVGQTGNYTLTIDVNQNNDFDDDLDKVLIGTASVGTNSVSWGGLDGQNNPLPIGVHQVKLTWSDEVHFPFFDVENNSGGLILTRETSCSTGVCDVVYYDDTDPNVGGNKKLDGEPSSSGAHVFPGNNFGNDKGIDTWTSITADASLLEINIKKVDLEVTKKHLPDNLYPGSAVTYSIEVQSNGGNFSDVTGIGVKDVIPSSIIGVTWECKVDPIASGNNCAQTSGTGNIDTTVNLKQGAKATFKVEGVISSSSACGNNIENTVTITTPHDVTNNSDGATENAKDTITLSCDPSLQPPVANDDSASTDANTPVTIPVLDNDTDDNNSLDKDSVKVTTPPDNGTTQVVEGKIQYTPNPDFGGTDKFDYKVCNTDTPTLCDLATVTVNVTLPLPPPPPPPPPPPLKKLLSITIEGKGTVTSNPGRIDCHIIIGICALGFEANTLVTLSAEPDPGWEFKEWQQNCSNNGEVTLNSDKQCKAIFVQKPPILKTLTVSITGQGSVTITPPLEGIDCEKDCSNEYPEGTAIVLKATPATDWKFKGWEEDCNQSGKVTLLTDKQCRAVFTPKSLIPLQLQLTVYKTGQGTVVSEPSGIDCGEICLAPYGSDQVVRLTATPDPGWQFEGWRGHCNEQGEVTLVEIDKQCRAIFTLNSPSPLSALQLTVYKTGQGTVVSEPSGIDCGKTCLASYGSGQVVQLMATPDPGWYFKGWRGHCNEQGEVTLVAIDKQCRAIFTYNGNGSFDISQLQLAVSKTGQGTVVSEPSGIDCGEICSASYENGQVVQLIATPDSGWQFEGWQEDCDEPGKVTLSKTDKQCRAIFTEAPFPPPPPPSMQLTVSKTGQGTVVSEPSGIDCGEICLASYESNQVVQLMATPEPGWQFEGWQADCNEQGEVVRNNTGYAQCRAIFSSLLLEEDEDHDGVLNTTENVAPNNGDGNGDGTPDSQQNNVISLPINGQYVTVEETNGCVVDSVQAVASDSTNLNLSCSQAEITNYSYIQGQLAAVKSFSLIDGSTEDSSPAGDGKITYTLVHDKDHDGIPTFIEDVAPNNGDGNNDGSPDSQQTNVISLPINGQYVTIQETNGCVVDPVQIVASGSTTSDAIDLNLNCSQAKITTYSYPPGQPTTVEFFSLSDGGIEDSSPANDGKIKYEFVPHKLPSCPIGAGLIEKSQILRKGETTTITFDVGPGEFSIQTLPTPTLVSVDDWKSLNGQIELSLTGLNIGNTQMIMSGSSSSQQVILNLTVILPFTPPEPVPQKHLTNLQVGQAIDYYHVEVGQGLPSITQMSNDYLVSLTNWQSYPDGTASFTLTGLKAGDTSLVITDGSTPPQETHFDINIVELVPVQPDCQEGTLGMDLEEQPNQACFIGNIMSWGDLRSNPRRFTSTEAQNTRVTATVHLDPEDIGKTAEIFLVGKHTDLNGETTLYFRDDSRDQSSWDRWNGQITPIPPFTQIPPSQYYPQLPGVIDIFIYEGDLSKMPGEFTVYVGYQLPDNTIIYNGLDPIHFWVDKN
jgi:hypothetical protein